MPRYFFDIGCGPSAMEDDEGCDLGDNEAARQLAVELLGETIIHHWKATGGEVRIEVRNQKNAILRVSAIINVVPATSGKKILCDNSAPTAHRIR